MQDRSHDFLVAEQFGARAQAYLDSPVHARGEDLDQMVAIVGARPNAVALDLGCGGGHASFLLAPLVGKMVAYDLSDAMLATVRGEATRRGIGNVETRQGSAELLPFPDEAFDLVVSRYSAHHWNDLDAGLREARRIMKPGGLAVFMDVAAPESALLDTWLQSLELLRDPSHVRNFSVREWRRMLEEAGFQPAVVSRFRLRLEFKPWIERMNPPPAHVTAIRSLQAVADAQVAKHFAFEPDGSFTLDTMLISATTGNKPSRT